MNQTAAIGSQDAGASPHLSVQRAPAPSPRAARPAVDTARARAFRKAARHSRLIRVLRVAIPIAIVSGLGVIAAAMLIDPFGDLAQAKIDPGKIVVNGSKVAMDLPRVAGFTHDQRRYEVTAKAAFQDLGNPGVLEFETLSAKVETKADGEISIVARNGVYNTKQETLRLDEDIVIRTGSGLEATLRTAVLDVKAGTVVSESPVTVALPEGTVDANRLDLSDGGAVLKFSKGVRTSIFPGARRTPTPTAQAGSR